MVTPEARADEELHRLVEGMWNQEVTPISAVGDVALSQEDNDASQPVLQGFLIST